MYALKFSLRELQDLMGKKLQIIASRKLTSVIFDVVMDLYCQSSAVGSAYCFRFLTFFY